MSPRFSASAPLDQISEDTPKELKRTALSFEVIPPRHDADAAKIDRLLATLAAYNPDYIAVTSSQRSGWLEGTAAFIEKISRATAMRPLAHLACTAGTEEELVGWIDTLVDAGVRGLLALRGDLPEGGMPEGHLPHADSLVRLIRRWESDRVARLAAGRLAVGVACYPNGHAESATSDEDIDVLLAKQRLGADFAITQLFFDAEDYVRFAQRARLAGVRIPLIPGIMPMTSRARVERMCQLSGLDEPTKVLDQLAAATSPEEEKEIGMQITAKLAKSVMNAGADGLHIYTHNNPDITTDLLYRIGVTP
ncbi:MAG TPA: methylenetetrahydrofolate reductase [Candidatus Corynebacterium faecipullorum]|nr:methylenetetrahydrofolate reductase [Candidatus Corynebacterium faecipullorum]